MLCGCVLGQNCRSYLFLSWDESLRCRGTGCQNRRCLPLKVFSKVNLAESKVEKLSCLASLLNSSRHVTLLFLFLHVLSVFEWITEKERCRQGGWSYEFEDESRPRSSTLLSKNEVFIVHVSAAARTNIIKHMQPLKVYQTLKEL